MPDRFTFTGQAATGFFAYRDTDTGSMLVAEPGGTYRITATEDRWPIPPDGRWVAVPDDDTKPAKATPKVTASSGAGE